MALPEQIGEIDFSWPSAGKPCKTWYRVIGDLHNSKKRPFVILHGGPGLTPDYLYPLDDLWTQYGIPLLYYNQIGSGYSTHLPEKNGDEAFWSEALFRAELDNVIAAFGIGKDFDLLGHSWGGMLASAWAAGRPAGLRRLVICNSPVTTRTWERGAMYWLQLCPQDLRERIEKHEREGTTDSQGYAQACIEYYERHVCRMSPLPAGYMKSMEEMEKDPTVYHTMFGKSEFNISGWLIDWSTVEAAKSINVPTLLVSGRWDIAQEDSQKPFFKNIPKVKWVRFENSSHMPFFEERERFMELIFDFLDD